MSAMALAIMGITCVALLPDEIYPGGWLWWHFLLYNVVFIIITNLGIFGAYLMCSKLLWPYSLSMFFIIGLNLLTWKFFPQHSLMDVPFDVILITSLFDITAMIGSFYLVYEIKKQRNASKVTPVKSVDYVEVIFENLDHQNNHQQKISTIA